MNNGHLKQTRHAAWDKVVEIITNAVRACAANIIIKPMEAKTSITMIIKNYSTTEEIPHTPQDINDVLTVMGTYKQTPQRILQSITQTPHTDEWYIVLHIVSLKRHDAVINKFTAWCAKMKPVFEP